MLTARPYIQTINITTSRRVCSQAKLTTKSVSKEEPETFRALDCTIATIPDEPKSGGHVTITHQMLASIFKVFCSLSPSSSDKKCWENFMQGFSCSFPKLVVFHIYLDSKWKRLMFRRLTLWREEII